MMKRTEVCTNTAFYLAQLKGVGFEEARAVVIGMYSQSELTADIHDQVRTHLNACAECRQILDELHRIDEFLQERQAIPYAICPSGEKLDTYHFGPETLDPKERSKLAKHLQECPLCTDEIAWLERLKPAEQTFVQTRSWSTYLAVAAAMAFLLISLAVLWNNRQTQIPEKELQALAVIKEPQEIDFAALQRTSSTLAAADAEAYQKGVALFKQDHFAEAASLLENVLRNNPNHSATQMLLGYSYYRLGKPELAFDLCNRAEQMRPHSLERCLLLVNVALKTRQFERAILEITSLYHVAPDHPEVNRLYHRIHDLTKGRALRL